MKKWLAQNYIMISVITIILFGVICYANSLQGEFIGDDLLLVCNNHVIQSWSNLQKVLTDNLFPNKPGDKGFYRPLPNITYMLDYSLWKLNPFGYHLTNMILHIGVTLALFWLLLLLLNNPFLSFLTSIIYLIHPVHCEAVSYVSGRADLLAVLFLLLSFVFYLKYLYSERPLFLFPLFICFACAILSKENALVFPGLLVLYHLAFRKPVKYKLFLFLSGITIIACIHRLVSFTNKTAEFVQSAKNLAVENVDVVISTAYDRIPGIFIAILDYMRMLLLPFHLHMDYGQVLFSFNNLHVILGVIFVITLLVYAFKVRLRNPVIFFGIGWFFITLLPVSNIIHLFSYKADHFLYLPSIGLVLILVFLLYRIFNLQKAKIILYVLIFFILGFYSVLTIKQNNYWRTAEEFFQRTLLYRPNSVFANFSLGVIRYKHGKLDVAKKFFHKVIQIKPNYEEAYYNIGFIANQQGNPEQALEYYTVALTYTPKNTIICNKIGNIYYSLKDQEKCFYYFNKVIELDPLNVNGYINRAVIYYEQGKYAEAEQDLKKAKDLGGRVPSAFLEKIHKKRKE